MAVNQYPRPIEWVVALLAAVVSWQIIDIIDNYIDIIAFDIGIKNGSILYKILDGTTLPVIFVLITWLAMKFYEDVLWARIRYFGCKKGWFIYDLVSIRDNKKLNEIRGYFYLDHKSNKTEITEGRAFFYNKNVSSYRGGWSGPVIWNNPRKIGCYFTMTTKDNISYQGFFTLSLTTYKPETGGQIWEGRFYDFDQRSGISGYIRSRSTDCRNRSDVQNIFENQVMFEEVVINMGIPTE